MENNTYIDIEKEIEQLDKALQDQSQDNLLKIQASLNSLLPIIELEDVDAFSYYKYLIAEKYLSKAQLNDKQKKQYENQQNLYSEKYLEYSIKVNQKNNNNNNNQFNEGVNEIINLINSLKSLNKNDILSLSQIFQQLIDINEPFTIIEFMKNNKIFDETKQYLQLFICSFAQNEEQQQKNDQKKSQVIEDLETLRIIDLRLEKIINFLNFSFLLNINRDPYFMQKYYGKNIIDIEDAKIKFSSITKIFHPDKYQQYFYQDEQEHQVKQIMRNLFDKNKIFYEQIELEIKKRIPDQNIENLLIQAQKYFNEANRCQKLNQNYRKDTQEDNKHIQKSKIISAKQSYQYYRKAMQMADKSKQFDKSIIIRNNISLCFYLMENYALAQLYVIGSLYSLEKHKNIQNRQQLFDDTIKVLNKANGKSRQCNQQSENQTNINQLQVWQNQSHNYEIENINQIIDNQFYQSINFESIKQVLMVRYENSNEYDLQRQKEFDNLIKKNQIKSLVVNSISFLVGLAFIPQFLQERIQNIIQIVRDLYKQKQIKQQKEKLNHIYQKALKLYKEQEYYTFLQELQKPFNDKKQQLIKITEGEILQIRDYDKLIDILKESGFRPDAIAHLLLIIGEAVLQCKEYFDKQYYTKQKEIYLTINEEVLYSKKLFEYANQIDFEIQKLIFNQKLKIQKKSFFDFFSEIFLQNLNSFNPFVKGNLINESQSLIIACDDINQKKYKSYVKKLQEIQEIAQLNICLIRILKNEFTEAKNSIRWFKTKFQKQKHSDTNLEQKMDALVDFIKIFDQNFDIESIKVDNQQIIVENFPIQSLEKLIQECKANEVLEKLNQLSQTIGFDKKVNYYLLIKYFEQKEFLEQQNQQVPQQPNQQQQQMIQANLEVNFKIKKYQNEIMFFIDKYTSESSEYQHKSRDDEVNRIKGFL